MKRGGWVAWAGIAALVSWASSASAQLCINSPLPLPGLQGPPIWAGNSGQLRIDLHDPRWANAPLRRFPQDPVGTEAGYRMIKNGQELSVSVQALIDPALNANDAVYFAFGEGGTVAHLARINLPPAGVEPIAPMIFHAWDRSAATWTDTGSIQPAWLRDPAAWRIATAAPTAPADPGWEAVKAGVAWAINFKVDLPATALTDDFRIFLGVHLTLTAGSLDYYLPDYGGGTAVLSGTIVPEQSDTDVWQSVKALDTACATGVSLASNGIGTTNDPASAILGLADSSNVFFADPTGLSDSNAGELLATFRLARWTALDDPQAPWSIIVDAGAVENIEGEDHVHTFTCTPTSGATCPELGAEDLAQQCLLVELRPGPSGAADMPFQGAAAVRCDMHWVGAEGGAGGAGGASTGAGGTEIAGAAGTPTSGAGGDSAAGGSGNVGGSSSGEGGSGASGNDPAGASGTPNEGGAGGRKAEEDDGCGCRLPGERRRGSAWTTLLLVLALFRFRSRPVSR